MSLEEELPFCDQSNRGLLRVLLGSVNSSRMSDMVLICLELGNGSFYWTKVNYVPRTSGSSCQELKKSLTNLPDGNYLIKDSRMQLVEVS